MASVKVTLNLTPDDIATLEALSASSAITKTTALRRAISTLNFVAAAQASHRKILIESRPGHFREIAFPI